MSWVISLALRREAGRVSLWLICYRRVGDAWCRRSEGYVKVWPSFLVSFKSHCLSPIYCLLSSSSDRYARIQAAWAAPPAKWGILGISGWSRGLDVQRCGHCYNYSSCHGFWSNGQITPETQHQADLCGSSRIYAASSQIRHRSIYCHFGNKEEAKIRPRSRS